MKTGASLIDSKKAMAPSSDWTGKPLPTLTVTPPLNQPFPPPGSPVVDVEGYIGPNLIGGFRKEFHLPIPLHQPGDPPYAEREITIDPYPPRAGEPTQICVELRNSTNVTQTIWVEFAWANFGIGLPFHPFHGQLVTLPPHSISIYELNLK